MMIINEPSQYIDFEKTTLMPSLTASAWFSSAIEDGLDGLEQSNPFFEPLDLNYSSLD